MRKLLLLAALLLVATSARAAELTETIDKTFDVKPGAKVVLTNVNGRITVNAWDQPRVRIVAEKRVEGDRNEVKQALRELRVDMQPREGGVVITTRHPKNSEGFSSFLDWLAGDHIEAQVRYDVYVPRTMNMDVSNTNGTIHVIGVAGRHELETTNGKIKAERCAGSMTASTTNGGIDAELVSVTKGQGLRFETTNGKIEVAVPADLAAEVDASTTNGSIESDLPVLTTRAGSNSLRGTINGGGTPLRMRTTNGGIEIRTTR
ncbi:MAG: DUF4097 family beta strand repeat-containing protein [Thermoanaerobaculia bacterium]